jgi:NAD(P)-dependent dehydrogenase (short-subunit alcohol dehydrogenase family)
VDNSLRYVGGAVGFGFGALWMTAGIGAAIACLLLAALGYGVVFIAERAQANARTQDAHEPDDDATSPLAAEAEYGWPLSHDVVAEPTV